MGRPAEAEPRADPQLRERHAVEIDVFVLRNPARVEVSPELELVREPPDVLPDSRRGEHRVIVKSKKHIAHLGKPYQEVIVDVSAERWRAPSREVGPRIVS